MHDGRIAWPRCRALDSRGGSGLLIDEAILRAIRTESAEALKHWFGVGVKAVWRWRTWHGPQGEGNTRGAAIRSSHCFGRRNVHDSR